MLLINMYYAISFTSHSTNVKMNSVYNSLIHSGKTIPRDATSHIRLTPPLFSSTQQPYNMSMM